jgi:hypothetical protein
MSYSTFNQNGQSDSGYGGGKSTPPNTMYNQPGPQPSIPENPNYQGGPPKLDLSGLFGQTPAQKVADSQANGGILKLRNKQPFNPNPTPDPGFGGGKGLIQPIGGTGGFGGGKGMMRPMDMQNTMQNAQNQQPTNTYGQY